MALTAPPTAPTTADPATFDGRADAFVAWHATNTTELDALLIEMQTLATGMGPQVGGGAAGTLVYQSATNVTAFVAVGANTDILTLVAGVPAWVSRTSALVVAPVALTSGATVATDASLSSSFTLLLAHNATLSNPTNLVNGMPMTWRIKQAAATSYTLAFGSKFRYVPSATAPTMTTAFGSIAIVSGIYNAADDVIDYNMLVRA